MKPSVFRDPEPPKALLPRYRSRVNEVKSLITPHRIMRGLKGEKWNLNIFRLAVRTAGVFQE